MLVYIGLFITLVISLAIINYDVAYLETVNIDNKEG